MVLTETVLFVIGLVLLVKGSDFFVNSAVRIAKRLGVSEFVIGLTLAIQYGLWGILGFLAIFNVPMMYLRWKWLSAASMPPCGIMPGSDCFI